MLEFIFSLIRKINQSEMAPWKRVKQIKVKQCSSEKRARKSRHKHWAISLKVDAIISNKYRHWVESTLNQFRSQRTNHKGESMQKKWERTKGRIAHPKRLWLIEAAISFNYEILSRSQQAVVKLCLWTSFSAQTDPVTRWNALTWDMTEVQTCHWDVCSHVRQEQWVIIAYRESLSISDTTTIDLVCGSEICLQTKNKTCHVATT